VSELATVTPIRPTDQVKRDRWGHYMLPHPETGKEQAWWRATTIADTLEDRRGLEEWAKRNVALGIGARRDLYAQAAAARPDDKSTLGQIVKQAEEAASSKAGANLGSALHRFTERIDAGEEIAVPEPWAADISAYTQTMAANGITVASGWIERILLVPEIDTAGTCDRLCNGMWPLPRIGDLKTGKEVVKYGMTKIACQLAIYAHATHWYDPTTHQLHAMPHVDQTVALVMHLPVGQGTCTIYQVDIQAGWQAVQLALDVRKWRQRKDLAHIINAPAPMPMNQAGWSLRVARGMDAKRLAWARDRVEAIKAAGDAPLATLVECWSLYPEIPTFKKGGPTTDDELAKVIEMCDYVEAQHGIPFGPTDPSTPKQTKIQRKTTA
jgi:hypothetical protein